MIIYRADVVKKWESAGRYCVWCDLYRKICKEIFLWMVFMTEIFEFGLVAGDINAYKF